MGKDEGKQAPKKKFPWVRVLLIIANVLVIAGLGVFGGYYFKKYNDIKKNPPTATELAKQENARIIEAVGKLYSTPKDEEPIILFIKDKNALTDEEKKVVVFDKSENGDYQLIYTKGKIALLYRPSENRLVDVRPVIINDAATVKVLGSTGARDGVKKVLGEAYKDTTVYKDGGEFKGTYEKTMVFDIGGKRAELAKKIADSLKGEVITVAPAGEDKPTDAEIVVYSVSGDL